MVKKLFAQLALMIMMGLLMAPVVFAGDKQEANAENILTLADPYDFERDGKKDIEARIQEQIPKDPQKPLEEMIPGRDNGYVISIMEEPLNTDPSPPDKETKIDGTGPNYVVRRCYRNSFQYTKITIDKDNKKSYSTQTVPMLAKTCSTDAQKIMKEFQEASALKEYAVKYSCKEVQVILTKGGTSAIYGYISMLYRWGASMVGIIAVTVIIVSGIQISASGGDSEAINSAKKRILQSITGIVVLFLSSLILYTINPTFFVK